MVPLGQLPSSLRALRASESFGCFTTSTPQLPFETPQIPSNRDHKAHNRGKWGGLGRPLCLLSPTAAAMRKDLQGGLQAASSVRSTLG